MKIFFKIIFAVIFLVAIFLGLSLALEFRPANIEELETIAPAKLTTHSEDSTLTILAWNIGYCGLDKDMDFFFDGGTRTRTSKQQTEHNLEQIISTIKDIDADIVLLQEVDTRASRSYKINQKQAITSALEEYYSSFAYNFKTFFVPKPIANPLGRVEAGLLTLSKAKPLEAQRLQYPVSDKLPLRMFNLKRAALISKIEIGKDTIIIVNTHNSAYDNGTARRQENAALEELLKTKTHSSIVGGDWNQIPPSYTLSPLAASDPNYTPISVNPSFMSNSHAWAADLSVESLRYLDKAYKADGNDKTAITDFFLVPKSAEVISIKTLDYGFENSDHNPVLLTIKL